MQVGRCRVKAAVDCAFEAVDLGIGHSPLESLAKRVSLAKFPVSIVNLERLNS